MLEFDELELEQSELDELEELDLAQFLLFPV